MRGQGGVHCFVFCKLFSRFYAFGFLLFSTCTNPKWRVLSGTHTVRGRCVRLLVPSVRHPLSPVIRLGLRNLRKKERNQVTQSWHRGRCLYSGTVPRLCHLVLKDALTGTWDDTGFVSTRKY